MQSGVTENVSDKVLKYCLENASVKSVQNAVKAFRPINIAYDLKRFICSEFGLNKGAEFGVVVSSAFERYKTKEIELIELNHSLNKVRVMLRAFGRYHPDYPDLVIKHDALCILNNQLNEPITQFLKDYKSAQKKQGKKISIRTPKQPRFYNPFKTLK